MENKLAIRPTHSTETSLFRQMPFLLLWFGTLFSGLGISMFYFTEAWYVVKVLNLEASLGIIYLVGTIPRIIFMLIGGVFADKISPSKIMFLSDVTKAVLIASLAILLIVTGKIVIWTLILFAVLIGIIDAFFWPASGSIIPSIISKSFLTRANSVIQTTNQATLIIGPMISGFIIVSIDYVGALGLISFFLFCGSMLVFLIKINKQSRDDNNSSFFSSVKEGISYVKGVPVLIAFVLKTLFLNLFFTGPFIIGLPIFVKNVLNGSALNYSLIEAFLAFGMLSGSLCLGWMNLKRKRGIISLAAQMFMSICFFVLGTSSDLIESNLIVVFLGLAMTISNICAVTVIQNAAKPEMIGRVMSIQTVSSMGLTPISFGLTSLLLSIGIGIQTIMIGSSILLLLFTLFIFVKIPILRSVN